MFKYTIDNADSKISVTFEGDLDIEATEIVEEDITPCLMECKKIEIDFSNVHFVDSTGIGLLITLVNNLRSYGNQVFIQKVNEDVMQVFSLLQLPDILGNDVFSGLE